MTLKELTRAIEIETPIVILKSDTNRLLSSDCSNEEVMNMQIKAIRADWNYIGTRKQLVFKVVV